MTSRKLIAGALVWTAACLFSACSSSDGQSTGTGGSGGSSATGGTGVVALPQLTVNGNKLQDPSGKTIVLRGSSLIDIGALYTYSDVSIRLDAVAAAGVEGHVVRMPVYPKINYNSGKPYCSPNPYPIGTGPSTSCTPAATTFSVSDYDTKVLKPAVDYATSKNLYVIIDYHQIDNASSGTSAADANTFWTDVAPQFASYTNVFYEIFNEPIDTSVPWSTLKPVVQGLINTVRAAAPHNVIIVPSNSWDQHTGDAASDPPTGGNLMFTAHIYADNWNSTFQSQVSTAAAKVPVFVTEWGYNPSDSSSFGPGLQTTLDGDGASWTAWVTDNSWTPAMFTDASLTTLTAFGTQVKTWLAATANTDWVQ
ncbi:MAG TPA: cellulase family glycosylhydrolase [Polyangia bacterium]|nr:cellulase family glycosylhydrolase [Polyangia bacterium]